MNDVALSANSPWARLLHADDRAAAVADDTLMALSEKYGQPVETSAGPHTMLATFELPTGEVSFLRSDIGHTLLAGWRLWRGDLCSQFGPPIGLVTASGTGTSSFIPILGSSAAAIAAATAAAGLIAGRNLWAAIDRASIGRCQLPCTCQAIPVVPAPPAIAFTSKTVFGLPVLVTVSVSLSLSALLICA